MKRKALKDADKGIKKLKITDDTNDMDTDNTDIDTDSRNMGRQGFFSRKTPVVLATISTEHVADETPESPIENIPKIPGPNSAFRPYNK